MAHYLTKQADITGQKLLNTTRSKVYSVLYEPALNDSNLTFVKTWSQLMKVEDYPQNGIPIPANVTYPTDDNENYLNHRKMRVPDSNVSTMQKFGLSPSCYYTEILQLSQMIINA